MLIIRRAMSRDLKAITEIYNGAILNTVATFDTETKSLADRQKWFESHGTRYPVMVAEMDGDVVGWASLSAYSDRCAYAETAEISLYIMEGHYRKGFGKKLTETIMQEGRLAGLHTLLARITQDNHVSIHLAESLGFNHVGVMKEVGRKFGRLLDVEILQFIYETG